MFFEHKLIEHKSIKKEEKQDKKNRFGKLQYYIRIRIYMNIIYSYYIQYEILYLYTFCMRIY